jgi:hypothetical protein
MTSDKQLRANRANATKSTGPRSQAGKARSRMNALTHGFSSQEIVLEGESADQFDALRAQYQAEFDPNSAIERELVDRLAVLQWRLRRVPVFEAALIRARREATTTRGVYTYTITEEGMKDAEAFLSVTDSPQPVVKPWGAYEAACQAARKRSSPPSVEATRPTANEPSYSAEMPITDPSHEAETKRDHHHNQLSSSATGLALIKDSEDHDTLSKLSRYEAGLMNAIAKTLSAIQAIRNSGLLAKKMK